VKKNQLNRLKFLKNQPVRFGFGFISLKQKKQNRTKPNLNRKNKKNLSQTAKKPSKIDLNRFLSKKTEPKPVGLNWFRFF